MQLSEAYPGTSLNRRVFKRFIRAAVFFVMASSVLCSCDDDDDDDASDDAGVIELTLSYPNETVEYSESYTSDWYADLSEGECWSEGIFVEVLTVEVEGALFDFWSDENGWSEGSFQLTNSWGCENELNINTVFSSLENDIEDMVGAPVVFVENNGGQLNISQLSEDRVSLTWSGTCEATDLYGEVLISFGAELTVTNLKYADYL